MAQNGSSIATRRAPLSLIFFSFSFFLLVLFHCIRVLFTETGWPVPSDNALHLMPKRGP